MENFTEPIKSIYEGYSLDKLTTIEKMYLIKRLMDDIETETRETAMKVEPLNRPIYRVIKEGISDYFKVMSQNFHSQTSAYKIEQWEKQLNSAYELIESQKKKSSQQEN